jgi:aspartyl/asparaginyl beta-hydroxylase (cupin superfamily)
LETRTVHDPAAFPWVPMLEREYPAILDELNAVLAQKIGFQKVFEKTTEAGEWAAYPFALYGHKYEANCARCPRTSSVLQSIPGVGGLVCFSAFAPHTRTTPHCGVTNSRLRGHLGLKIPPDCGIRVGRDGLRWTEGKCLVFDDSFEHQAWNESNRPRFILMFDFPHPNLVREEIDNLADFEASLSAQFVEAFGSWADQIPEWVYGLDPVP